MKLLAEPDTLRLIGGQIHGGEGVKERADFLAFAAKRGATLEDIAWMENIYSPPIGALFEPMAIAAQNGLAESLRTVTALDRMKRRLRDRSEHYLMLDVRAPARSRRRPARRSPTARRGGVLWRLAVRPALPAAAVGAQAAGDGGAADDRDGLEAAGAPAARAVAPTAQLTGPSKDQTNVH